LFIVNIGVDGGGTKTCLLASDASDQIWSDEGAAANPRIVGIERSSTVLSGLIDRAIDQYPDAREFRICAGIAGAATSSLHNALTDSVKLDLRSPAGISLKITDDATIAYEAAFEGAPGVLLVVGTGSMILVRTLDGSFFRSGGWGYLLGDEGSGYSLGRAGLRAVAASIDANEPTALTTRAASELEVTTREALLDKVYDSSYSLASFAPAVLDEAGKGDATSATIVDREIRKLVDRLHMLTEGLERNLPGIIKVAGGLSKSRPYMLTLSDVVTERFAGWEVTRSGRESVEGALWLAKQMSD